MAKKPANPQPAPENPEPITDAPKESPESAVSAPEPLTLRDASDIAEATADDPDPVDQVISTMETMMGHLTTLKARVDKLAELARLNHGTTI